MTTPRERPCVLLYSATPRADQGGVQRIMDDLQLGLPGHGIDVARAGPDESHATGGLCFAAQTDATVGGRPALAAIPGAARSLLQLVSLLRHVRPDVVNIHFITGEVVYFLILRRLFGFRVLLSAHGSDLLDPTPQMRRHLPRIVAAADAVSVVSNQLARAARDFASGRLAELHNIPNGTDTQFWCPSDRQPVKGRIVAAGRLLPVKGFDLLIDAMAQLPDGHLRILGEGQERAALQDRIDRLGLSDRIALVGHVAPRRMRDEFRAARFFVLASRSEGMPLTLLEALACGCPVIATAVGGTPDVLTGDAGRLVPADNAQALRQALADAFAGTTGFSRKSARKRGEAYSQQACCRAYAALIQRLSHKAQTDAAA